MAKHDSWWKPQDSNGHGHGYGHGRYEDYDDVSGQRDMGESVSAAQKTTKTSFVSEEMKPPPVERDGDGETLPTRRVHILGLGNVGLFVAYSLKQMPNPPPITLMMHRPDVYDAYKKRGRLVRVRDKATGLVDEQDGFDVDIKIELPVDDNDHDDGNPSGRVYWKYVSATEQEEQPEREEDEEGWKQQQQQQQQQRQQQYRQQHQHQRALHPLEQKEILPSGEVYIHCLILTVKAQHTVMALLGIKHRLNAKSTICLLQNGLGQIEKINRLVFPDPATRPTYLIGVFSHGCYSAGAFVVVHSAVGVTSLGIYRDTDRYPLPPPELADRPPSALSPEDRALYFPTDEELYNSSLSARFLLRSLTRCPPLYAAAYPYLDLKMLQLEKLSTNAIINPLTALYNVPNGGILGNQNLNIVQNMLVSETSLVLRNLPELQPIPNIRHRFSAGRLKELCVLIAQRTQLNSSSMREDLRLQRWSTEIDFLNGYIIQRGQELGIPCAGHFMLMHMLKARLELDRHRDADYLPYDTGKRVVGDVDFGKLAATATTLPGGGGGGGGATAAASGSSDANPNPSRDDLDSDSAPVTLEDQGGEKPTEKAVTQ